MNESTPIDSAAPERPLITFALFAYKQERFIREAMAGALAQTYSPLEIILSDDCSPDRTFEIMQEMTMAYRGPHLVKLNQTVKNGGLALHFNSVMAMATGELVVVAAGDDISLPHRVETLTKQWIRVGKPSGIGSGLKNIDELGKLLGPSEWALKLSPVLNTTAREQMLRQFVPARKYALLGCSAAWSKEMWDKFGCLRETVITEDDALSFRSLLDRGLHVTEEELVQYRCHADNVQNTKMTELEFTPSNYTLFEETTSKRATWTWMMYENSLSDLNTAIAKNMIAPITAQAIKVDILKAMRRLTIQAKWWDLPFFKRLLVLPDSPHRRFPLNITSLLPLNQHAALRCSLARIKGRWHRQNLRK